VEHARLGRSGLSVSRLIYGNWITHGAQVDDRIATSCVHAALDAGITTFDTADVYARGRAEEVLGEALHGLPRDELEIATKVFWPMGERPNQRGLSRKHILEACDASLRRLRIERIDLYQAHRFDHQVPLEETLRTFDDLVRQGKVGYIGVSEWTASQIRDAIEMAHALGLDALISNQPQYNAMWRVIEAEVVPTSLEIGVGQIVWSPIAQGVLTGKYRPGDEPPAGSRAASPAGSMFVRGMLDDATLGAAARFADVAREAGHEPAALAIAWTLHQPGITAAIVGASVPDQVTQNAAAIGIELDESLLDAIDEALADVIVTDPARTDAMSPRWD
jgi:aryl-alcohol dehydrogenase-like predicted oxidoreductase